MNLFRPGWLALAAGARRANPLAAGLGTALLVVGLLRRRRAPARRLLFARTLRPGEALRVRLLGSDEEIQIDG